ncbi:Gfo/Idh/MocA family protein [Micromonospora sp. LOL_023]|uniref:Gfo/Idh/MocA family protein n=1 Tax=Micromonospora sp. LOL_023 TaxID=3345418 RepID=UPI003A874BE2
MSEVLSAASGTVRVGLIGCADIAVRRILPALAGLPGTQLTAVASRRRSRAVTIARRFGGEPVAGYDELLRRTDVDAVYLPLPPAMHAEWIRKALEHGKHVLSEKPLTTSHEQTVDLVGTARRSGLVLMENYMFVHHTQHAAVRRMLTAGAIGELQAFSATFTIPTRPPGDLRLQPELGGGALLDVAGYPVRAAQLFLGRDLTVVGASRRFSDALGVDLGGAALLRHPDGVTAQLTFGINHRYVSSYQFLGSTGRISVDHVFTPPAEHRPEVRTDWQDRHTHVLLPAHDQYSGSLQAFLAAVRGDGGTDVKECAISDQAMLIDSIRQAQSGTTSGYLVGRTAGRKATP